jgi:PAS domain S-box-containing protein
VIEPAPPLRVLLVEDSADDAELIERTLREGDFSIDARLVADEAAFRTGLAEFSPDLVLSDWALPGFSGKAAVRIAREWDATVPCILVSGTLGEELVVQALRSGATDYVLKQRLEALAPAVRRALAEVAERREQARLTADLAATRARYFDLYDVAPVGYCTISEQGRILEANLTAATLLGVVRGGLVNQPIRRLIINADQDIYFLHTKQLFESGQPYSLELRMLKQGATSVWVHLEAMAAQDGDGARVCRVVMSDISLRKALEGQLLQAQKLESVGQLAGGIAHDFNNLLTAIHGYGELLGQSLPDDDPRRADLDEILRAADRAAELTRQLVAFSRRQILQLCVLDPAEVVDGIAPMLRRLMGENIAVVTRTAPDLGNVKADPSQLEQVILNLAVNARDAMPEGGEFTIATANVEISAEDAGSPHEVGPGRYVLLSFSDTGLGMGPETEAHAFEPYFTTKEPGKGTGMGLATVYGIVKQSSGSIYLHSEPGRGTTFKIYLPHVEGKATAATEAVALHPATTGSETILLVEDNTFVRAFARRVLESQGYAVLEAASGADALAMAASRGGAFDLLLTDVVMPGLQGNQLAEQLWAERPDLPVLYVSGFVENKVISQGNSRKGVAFLPKPFSADALGAAVRRVLDG